MEFFKRNLLAQGLFLLLCCITSLCYAGSAQYLYDNLGRLRAVGDGSSNYATYDYDEVGNLLSISTTITTPNPPVIQSINPVVFFIGTTTPISIVGQNLLTTKEIAADNPYLHSKILKATDTEIKAEVTVSSQALPASANLTLTTFYGSKSIQTELTSSKLSLGPSLLTILPGSSAIITASIYPALGKSISLQINNSDSSTVSAPQSIVIPADGTASFSVAAIKEGIVFIGSGESKAMVKVTTDNFTPLPGESITSATNPVSIYINNSSSAAIQTGLPVSVAIDQATSNAFQPSLPVSVSFGESGSTMQPSLPVSVAIDQPTSNALQPSLPVSVSFGESGSTMQPSLPVSVAIDQPASNALQPSLPVSVYLDQTVSTMQPSLPVSVSIDQPTSNALQPSLPVSVYLDQAVSTMQPSLPVSVSVDVTAGNSAALSLPVSTKISSP